MIIIILSNPIVSTAFKHCVLGTFLSSVKNLELGESTKCTVLNIQRCKGENNLYQFGSCFSIIQRERCEVSDGFIDVIYIDFN